MRYYRRLRSSESLKQWFERQRTRTCVPHTPYTSVLRFCRPQVGCMAQPCTRLVEMQATACYGLLFCCVLQAIFAFVQFPLVVR